MKKYLPYVNAKMGTRSVQRRSYGNTLPLTQLPFGMASFCLQTEARGAWFYHPEHEFTEGVRLTHQPSPWIGDYGTEIHEMTEMAAADFGQMAISNQPSFHIPFLYAALGAQEKTDYWVEKLVREAFNPGNAGYPGDEDNGSMSAWYIFASLGMYRLCPGKTEWIKCKRLVKQAKILGKEI